MIPGWTLARAELHIEGEYFINILLPAFPILQGMASSSSTMNATWDMIHMAVLEFDDCLHPHMDDASTQKYFISVSRNDLWNRPASKHSDSPYSTIPRRHSRYLLAPFHNATWRRPNKSTTTVSLNPCEDNSNILETRSSSSDAIKASIILSNYSSRPLA